MAFTAQVCGFEGGDGTGTNILSVGAPSALAIRTGSYGFRTSPVATAQFGVQIGTAITGFASGTKHACYCQFFYRMSAAPNANGTMFFGLSDHLRVTVNTDMTATLGMSGIGTTAITLPAVSSTVWYRVRLKMFTYNTPPLAFGTTNKAVLVTIDLVNADGTITPVSTASLSGLNIGHTSVPVLTLGSIAALGGGVATWSLDFDDCVYVGASEGDVDTFPKWTVDIMNSFTSNVFTNTRIYPILITGQGPNNGFTPAGDYSAINEVPMGTGTVASSTLNAWTDYLHQNGQGSPVEAITLRCNAASSGAVNHALTIDAAETLFAMGAGSASQNALSPFATITYPTTLGGDLLSAAAFNALVFGLRNKDGATTLTLQNMFIEALETELIMLEPADPFAVTPVFVPAQSSSTDIIIDMPIDEWDVTLGFIMGNQGVDINVPRTWQINRIDVGYRDEEELG